MDLYLYKSNFSQSHTTAFCNQIFSQWVAILSSLIHEPCVWIMVVELSKSSCCLNATGIVFGGKVVIKFASFGEHVDITPVGGTIDVSDLKLLFLYCIYEASSHQKTHHFWRIITLLFLLCTTYPPNPQKHNWMFLYTQSTTFLLSRKKKKDW